MIMGALQTLNEQAEEDTWREKHVGVVEPLERPPISSTSHLNPMTSTAEDDVTVGGGRLPRLRVNSDASERNRTGESSEFGDDDGDDVSGQCDVDDEDDDNNNETDILYLHSHSAKPIMSTSLAMAATDSRLSPRSAIRAVVDPSQVFWSENVADDLTPGHLHPSHLNANNVIEMDHIVEWNEKADKVSNSVLNSSEASSPAGDNHLNRLKRLLASVGSVPNGTGALRRGGSTTSGNRTASESPNYDSDTENSESAPLVSDRFPGSGYNWATNKGAVSSVSGEDDLEGNGGGGVGDGHRPRTPTLAIDAPSFRPFRTVPSWPNIGAFANSSMSRSVQTSPIKATAGNRKSGDFSPDPKSPSNVAAASKNLIEMLGGNETIL